MILLHESCDHFYYHRDFQPINTITYFPNKIRKIPRPTRRTCPPESRPWIRSITNLFTLGKGGRDKKGGRVGKIKRVDEGGKGKWRGGEE